MGALLQDISFAFRTLRKSPGFTAIAVVTIALGIGAGSAVFSMVEGVLLRRLPYASNDRLVRVMQPSNRVADAQFSIPEVLDYREQMKNFDMVAEYHSMPFQLYGLGEPQRVQIGVVSDNFFTMFGVKPLLGRTFTPGEEVVGVPSVVVLSYSYWMEHFGGDPKVIGAKFTMNNNVHTVVGVLPQLPVYPNANDMWMPAGHCPFRSNPATMSNRNARLVRIYGRLREGATLPAATAELKAVSARLHGAYPANYPEARQLAVNTISLRDELTATSRPLFISLFAMAAFVLLIAATNFANLTLSRQLRRAREIALRSALGADRGRIYRQLATESLLVTLTGAALGIAVASSGIGLLRTLAAQVTPRAGEITVNPMVLLFAIVVSVAVGLLAAFIPLRHAGGSVAERLRSSAATTSSRQDGRIRDILVAAQVIVAFVLLVAAGLMVRSLIKLEGVDGGYNRSNVMTARVSLNWTAYTTQAQSREFAGKLYSGLVGQPGVQAVGLSSDFPLANAIPGSQPFLIDGQVVPSGQGGPASDVTVVSEDYFKAIGIPVLQGRAFTVADVDTLNPPVVVSARLARTYWQGASALGSRLSTDNGAHWNTVVGVVGDVRQNGLAQDVTDEIYYPLYALPPSDIRVLVRTAGDPQQLARAIRTAVYAIDDKQAISSVQTLDHLRGENLTQPRVTATLLVAFALLSLAITAGGLGGVVASSVNQRVGEVGIRVALGASKQDVLWLVVRQALTIVGIGLGVGLVTAFVTARLFSSLLYATAPSDPLTFGGVGAALLVVAVIACLLPARRALAIEPVEALRAR